jgi:thymidylate synthase
VARVIEVNDMQRGYLDIVDHVLKKGRRVSPRGQATIEDLDVVIIHHDPAHSLPVNINRNASRPLASLEALQLIGGVSYPRLMVQVAPNMRNFMDGGILAGAYGPRVGVQLDRLIEKMRQDPDTRQGVVTIWDPMRDHFPNPPSKDVPCTIMQQFLLRDDRLLMHTTMRSNDVYWGVAYDIFAFTQLQLAVASALGVEPGPYHHHAVSLHAYERDLQALRSLEPPTDPAEEVGSIGLSGEPWPLISLRARQLMYHGDIDHMYTDAAVDAVMWHRKQAVTWA